MQLSDRIVVDPDIRFGRPTVRGTRITVTDVLSYLASGLSTQQITTTFPALTEADVLACLAFAADRGHGLGRTAHPNATCWLHSRHHVSAEGTMHLTLEVDREEDGRWLAEVPDLAGVLAYGQTRDDAIARAEALALRVLADRLEHGEAGPDLVSVSFRAA
ncbi:MAG TPA: DUF433 domain-containing protein [Gemmatimonadaceae bacterium]|nr:DUF433 domain-containing protein [Gemmatimonadaceae bacterium]